MIKIIDYEMITETKWIPPFGHEVMEHLLKKNGTYSRNSSFSAWRLLFKTISAAGIEFKSVSFNENGKPYFRDSDMSFSISHSGQLCAVSISNYLTGIDIEKVNRRIEDNVFNKVFSEQEREIYKINRVIGWCKKECVSKMNGGRLVDDCGITTTINRNIEYVIRKVVINYEEYYIVTGFMKSKVNL